MEPFEVGPHDEHAPKKPPTAFVFQVLSFPAPFSAPPPCSWMWVALQVQCVDRLFHLCATSEAERAAWCSVLGNMAEGWAIDEAAAPEVANLHATPLL